MLYLATNRRHKECNHSSHLILTPITGETCSKLWVTNNRWRSCTRRTAISTPRSLSLTRTHLRLAALLDDSSKLSKRERGIITLIDHSSFSLALLSSCPFWSRTAVPLSCFVCPRLPLSHFIFIFFRLVFFQLFKLVARVPPIRN